MDSITVDYMDQTYTLEDSILKKDKVDNVKDANLEEASTIMDGGIFKEDT